MRAHVADGGERDEPGPGGAAHAAERGRFKMGLLVLHTGFSVSFTAGFFVIIR